MNGTPTLETARLRIEPFAERHLTEDYVGWLNDPEIVRYSEQRHLVHSLDSCRAYLRLFWGTANHFWAISPGGKEGHIGTVTARVDAQNLVADVGILIGEVKLWGQGYASEVFDAVCSFLLQRGGMRKVTAGALSTNRAMLRVMEKAGMVPDGVRRSHRLWEGREVDVIHMAIHRDEGTGNKQEEKKGK